MLLSFAALALAGSLAGVTLPDTATVAGQTVTLNGMGLREKLTFDIYVGGLYLAHPTRDAKAAIAADEPKRIVMHFIYKEVTHEQLVETWQEGFAHQGAAAAARKADLDRFLASMPATIGKGEQIVIDYAPGVGTTVTVKGKPVGTAAGADFMKLIWTVFLGGHPPTEDLKEGMLGL